MTRATGGSACAATSTRSRFLPYAYSRASSVVLIPSCCPSSPIRRTRGTRIASLMRVWARACGELRIPPNAYAASNVLHQALVDVLVVRKNRWHAAARSLVNLHRLNLQALGREVRDGYAPACQGLRVASLAWKSRSDKVSWAPPCSRIASASSDSLSP